MRGVPWPASSTLRSSLVGRRPRPSQRRFPPDRVHPVAAAHTVAATQYTPANGVTAVVLAASALRGIDGMGHSCRSAP